MQASPAAPPGRRPRDMMLSMLVLLVPVFLLVGLYRWLGNETPPAVDPTSAYAAARSSGAFDVLTPQGLPEEWRLASATFTGGALRIGMTTPDDGAVQIVQSAAPADQLVPQVLGAGARPDGNVEINGVGWQRYLGARSERALLLLTTKRTLIIVGNASEAEFRTLAESLR